MTDASFLNGMIEKAAQLRFRDAAFFILARRNLELIAEDSMTPKPTRLTPSSIVMGRADACLVVMRRAHPGTSDTELELAIKSAMKLESDCLRCYRRTKLPFVEDLRVAVEVAKQLNPEFQEETYKLALNWLASQLM
jgi:hypothetical protein